MIAYIVYTLGLYVSDFVRKITSTLDFCSFRDFGFPKKLFKFNRLIVINFWRLIDQKILISTSTNYYKSYQIKHV